MKKTTTKRQLKELPKNLRQTFTAVQNLFLCLKNSLMRVSETHPTLKKIVGTNKLAEAPNGQSWQQKGEWGYIINQDLLELCRVVYTLKIKHILDLGCGMGVLMVCLKTVFPKIRIAGIDNEEELLKVFRTMEYESPPNIVNWDLTKLKGAGIEKFQALYFFEPLSSEAMAVKFVTQLAENTVKGQIMIIRPHGYILRNIQKISKFKEIPFSGLSTLLIYEVL